MAYVLFYEMADPQDCDVWKVFKDRGEAVQFLQSEGWVLDTTYCDWSHPNDRGIIYILDKELY